ncbi:MAG: ParB/RepB/Spo0J family partition protein [Oscillospiraceae bacterium]
MTDVNRSIKEIGLNERLLAFCEREEVKTVGEFLSRFEELEIISPKAAKKIMDSINCIEDDKRTIVYIDVDKIKPHPDNPRKDVGDVSNLAEDIKQNGIMQNLTVIPSEVSGEYITLIGHRRLAAAIAAGLDKVPCTVVGNLSRSEQISRMLAENMQREDLTLLEQADGIQMMLDLGDTISMVAKKTSMGETSIRERLKVLEHDREAVEAAVERGGGITSFIEINKIKDKAKQEKLINSIGTNNFKWELERALNDQKREKKKQQLIDFVKGFASELTNDADTSNLKSLRSYHSMDAPILPNNFDESLNYYYKVQLYSIEVYTDYTEADIDKKQQVKDQLERANARAAELNRRRKELSDIAAAMLNSRIEFLKNFKGIPQKKAVDKLCIIYDVNRIVTECLIDEEGYNFDWSAISEILCPDSSDIDAREYISKLDQDKLIIINLIASAGGFEKLEAHLWTCEFSKDNNLECIYKVLEMLGYKMSETEREYLNGTHEAFVKEEKHDS